MELFSNKNTVAFPMTERKFYQDSQVLSVKNQFNTIEKKYGKFISDTAKGCNIPEFLIKSFIMIESAGDEKAINGGTFGLGQLLPAGIQDIIVLENKDKKINAYERSIIIKKIGTRGREILAIKSLGGTLRITKADLLDPEFNIICIGIYLSRLIDQCTINGTVRYDLLPVGYNIGYFSFLKQKPSLVGKNTDQIIDSTNLITGNYIKKLVGKNGGIETLLKS
jgi:hypothetical protein